MTSPSERVPEVNGPQLIIDTYKQTEANRLDDISSVLETAWPIVSDLNRCNQALINNWRPDLAISERAAMRPVSDITDFDKPNNFGPYLQIYSRFVSSGSQYEDAMPVSISEEQLTAALRGKYKVSDATFLDKPVFHRMAALLPDFTTTLVLTLSAPENRYRRHLFLPELICGIPNYVPAR